MLSKKLKNNNELYTWSNKEILQGHNHLSSINFVLHYSSPAVWEGIRSYKSFTKQETNIVSLVEHVSRLLDSAKIVGFEIPYTQNEIIQGCKDIIAKNGAGDLYIRPIAYTTQDAESVRPQEEKVNLDIYAFPIPALFENKGARLGFSQYSRGYPQFMMQAKATPNYVHLQMCKEEIRSKGVDDVLLTDNLGYITEALVANIFIVKNGYLLTPPNDGSILPGITRKNVYNIFNTVEFKKKLLSDKMASKMPNFIVEKRITKPDILTADEVFMCGTYAEVVPVIEVEGRKIGNGEPGRFTSHLRQAYQDAVRNKVKYGVTLDKA